VAEKVEQKHGELSAKIIAAAYKVHSELGQGFAEEVYKNALAVELQESGITHALDVAAAVKYHDKTVGQFTADMVVDGKVIVEITAANAIGAAQEARLMNYLKATGIRLGILLNFAQSVEVRQRVFG
jgi:GxxExxY protein